MTIDLMTNNQPKNKINKTPTTVLSLTGTLKDDTSVMDPVILIESASFPSAANYAKITEFGRYYYIEDIVNKGAKLWEISLHVDVLKTYASVIMSSPCIIAKTASNDFNLYLPDPNFKCQQNDLYGMVSFPHGFEDTPKFYMTFFG